MCLVDIVTFLACGHKEYLFASACSADYSHEKNSCTLNYHEIRALIDSALGDFYCGTCYISKLDWLRDGYRHSYLNVIKEAQVMGWTKEDIRGSLTDIEIEMTEAVNEWKLECGRDEGLDDPKQYLQDKAALLSLFSVKPPGPKAKKCGRGRRRQNIRNTEQNTKHTKAKAGESGRTEKAGLRKSEQSKENDTFGIKQIIRNSFVEAMRNQHWRTC